MRKPMILICLILFLSGCNAQPTDVISEPKNDSFEAAVETECEPEQPSIDERIESIAAIPTESFAEVSDDISAESEGTSVVDMNSYVPEETTSAVVEEIKEDPVQEETTV